MPVGLLGLHIKINLVFLSIDAIIFSKLILKSFAIFAYRVCAPINETAYDNCLNVKNGVTILSFGDFIKHLAIFCSKPFIPAPKNKLALFNLYFFAIFLFNFSSSSVDEYSSRSHKLIFTFLSL